MQGTSHLYLIALGSNQRHPLLGAPPAILRHAIDALEMDDIDVFTVAPIIHSLPIGPSQRKYANSAALLVSNLEPAELLQRLHSVEAHFGRKRLGQQWAARTLDLDIILWSGGILSSENPSLAIPHPQFRQRGFVLGPASKIAPKMVDPITGLTLAQLQYRFLHPKPLDPSANPA